MAPAAHAATAQAIDAGANRTLESFRSQVKGADELLRSAKGVLVFPEVIQAGFGIGGEYGEGVLRIGGASVGYYNIASGSWGFQFGAQRKSIVIAFMQDEPLQLFRQQAQSDASWQAGIEGIGTLVTLGAQASINSATINRPIVGYVFGQAGLMYDLSLKGSKVSKIER